MNKKRDVSVFLFDDLLLVARDWEGNKEAAAAPTVGLHGARHKFVTEMKLPLKNMSVTDISGLEGGRPKFL